MRKTLQLSSLLASDASKLATVATFSIKAARLCSMEELQEIMSSKEVADGAAPGVLEPIADGAAPEVLACANF